MLLHAHQAATATTAATALVAALVAALAAAAAATAAAASVTTDINNAIVALDAAAQVVHPRAKLAFEFRPARAIDPLAPAPLACCAHSLGREAVTVGRAEDVATLREVKLGQAAWLEGEETWLMGAGQLRARLLVRARVRVRSGLGSTARG